MKTTVLLSACLIFSGCSLALGELEQASCLGEPADFCADLAEVIPTNDDCLQWQCNAGSGSCEVMRIDNDGDGFVAARCATAEDEADCDDSRAEAHALLGSATVIDSDEPTDQSEQLALAAVPGDEQDYLIVTSVQREDMYMSVLTAEQQLPFSLLRFSGGDFRPGEAYEVRGRSGGIVFAFHEGLMYGDLSIGSTGALQLRNPLNKKNLNTAGIDGSAALAADPRPGNNTVAAAFAFHFNGGGDDLEEQQLAEVKATGVDSPLLNSSLLSPPLPGAVPPSLEYYGPGKTPGQSRFLVAYVLPDSGTDKLGLAFYTAGVIAGGTSFVRLNPPISVTGEEIVQIKLVRAQGDLFGVLVVTQEMGLLKTNVHVVEVVVDRPVVDAGRFPITAPLSTASRPDLVVRNLDAGSGFSYSQVWVVSTIIPGINGQKSAQLVRHGYLGNKDFTPLETITLDSSAFYGDNPTVPLILGNTGTVYAASLNGGRANVYPICGKGFPQAADDPPAEL